MLLFGDFMKCKLRKHFTIEHDDHENGIAVGPCEVEISQEVYESNIHKFEASEEEEEKKPKKKKEE